MLYINCTKPAPEVRGAGLEVSGTGLPLHTYLHTYVIQNFAEIPVIYFNSYWSVVFIYLH